VLKEVLSVAAGVGEIYVMVVAVMMVMMMMISCRRMNNLLRLYLWLTID